MEYQLELLKREPLKRDAEVLGQCCQSSFAGFEMVLRSHFRYWLRDVYLMLPLRLFYYFNSVRPLRSFAKKPPVPFRLEQTA